MSDIAKKIGDIAANAAATGQTPDDISNIVVLEVQAALNSVAENAAKIARTHFEDENGRRIGRHIAEAILAQRENT